MRMEFYIDNKWYLEVKPDKAYRGKKYFVLIVMDGIRYLHKDVFDNQEFAFTLAKNLLEKKHKEKAA